jgi:hypothetical protein
MQHTPGSIKNRIKDGMSCLAIAEVTWTNMVAWPLTCGWHLDSTHTHTHTHTHYTLDVPYIQLKMY